MSRRWLAFLLLALPLLLGAEKCPPLPVPIPTPTPTPPVTTTTSTTSTTTLPPEPLPTPVPTPSPTQGCRAPQGNWIDPRPPALTMRRYVMEVLTGLSGCAEGTDCPLPLDNMQSWQEKVIAELRKGNPATSRPALCAGMHQDGVSDEITYAPFCQARWEGGKVFACTPAKPTDPPNFDTCPVIGRGKVRWAFPTVGYVPTGACSAPTPAPTPLPTPLPTPAPTPTPGGACPVQLPLPAPYELGLRIGPHGSSGQQYDATPFIKAPSSAIPPPGWTGACRTQQCDISPEKDPTNGAACTVQLCGDHVDYEVIPSSAGFVNWTSGFTVKITLTGPAVLRGTCPVSGVVQSIPVP